MSLKTRRYLYISFIILFLVITPLISLYASGYKLGRGFKIEKTGILILDTEPKGARIYIDSKIQKSFFKNLYNSDESYIKTPAKIKNILPGEYEVRFELENHWDWQKRLEVKPGKSTYAENVSLFKKNLPLLIEPGSFARIMPSDDKKTALLLEKNKGLYLFDLEKEEKTLISSSSDIYADIADNRWSQNKNTILAGSMLYAAGHGRIEITPLEKIVGKNNFNFKLDSRDEKAIYCQTNNSINYLDIKSGQFSNIIKNNRIEDYSVKNGYLYYVEHNALSSNLVIYEIAKKSIYKNISIPYSAYEFIHKDHDLINLYDKKHKILYLIDPFSPLRQLKETVNNLNKSDWINNNKMLYANDFEVWTLNLESLDKTLLTRISENITKTLWHPNDNYVIYSTSKSINIIELDNREKYNITKMLTVERLSGLFLNDAGNTLYFYAKIGNQEGFYKLFIQ